MNALAIIAAMTFGQLGIVPEKPATLRVIVFSAEWCGPCKILHREIERELLQNAALNWRDKIEFADVETSESAKLATKNKDGGYDVPQVIIAEGNAVVMRFIQVPSYLRIAHVFNAINATRKAK